MAIVALAAAVIAIVAYSTHLMRALELQSVDARFAIRGGEAAPEDIVVVEVDDRTFNTLGLQWPFPRSVHARLIDRLREAGAKTVAFDVQFTEATSPKQDNALIESVGREGGVVLSTTEVDADGESNVFGSEALVHELGARAASTVVVPEPGGVYRKMYYGLNGLTSFGVATAEEATGKKVDPDELEGDGKAWIDFRGPPGTFVTYSYSSVLRGEVPDSALRGKTVIVGASAPSLQDVHPTSTTGDDLMPGPEIQANAVWTAENGFPLSSSVLLIDLLLILAFAVAPTAVSMRLRPPAALGSALLLALAYAVVVQIAFEHGTILPVVYPYLALVVSALGALAVNYVLTAFERQRVHDTFSRFVPKAVVDEVLERTDGDLRFGGVRRVGTVLFSDIRGFTTFSETLEAERVIEVLNHYLEDMSDAIMDHGGTLVAYMGDGIMAVFGAPIEQDDHADRALAAARDMLDVRLPRVNEWIVEQGLGDGFKMGIGLHSGSMMSGQVGSKRRIEYTAIGDTTNTASRVEGMTKNSGHHLFLTDETRRALLEDPGDLEQVGEREVRGRSGKIVIWTVAEPAGATAPPPEQSAGGEQGGEEQGDDVK